MSCNNFIIDSFNMLCPRNILPVTECRLVTKSERQNLNCLAWIITVRFTVLLTSYALIKYPASARHFTLVPLGTSARKLSQCKIEVNPPAEQPERIAYVFKSKWETRGKNMRLRNTQYMVHTFWAFFIPFANRSSITATKTRCPLKWRLVAWQKFSTLWEKSANVSAT